MLRFFSILLFLCGFFCFGSAQADMIHLHEKDQSDFGHKMCQLPDFKCMKVSRGMQWHTLFPNAGQREIVRRLNRTNVPLKYRDYVIVPKSFKNINYLALSPFPMHRNTGGKKLLLVDLRVFAFAAYNKQGNLVYWGPASGGKNLCANGQSCLSAAGKFSVHRMHGEDCISHTFPLETNGGAPMPYCMFYHKGYAIHGSTLTGFNNHSQGCVRVFTDDAKWLEQHFVRIGTPVTVIR